MSLTLECNGCYLSVLVSTVHIKKDVTGSAESMEVVVLMMLQPEDDHERVREAVARTLAVGLMSDDFSVDLNEWLNPTEVRCVVIRYL